MIKTIFSWLAQLLRSRSQTGVNITIKGDACHANQKIVVIIKDHNKK